MKPFKVSIIVPVYNVEKYLSACLESLAAQTLEEVEIVAVNDGSTDGSLAVLKQFKDRYPEKLFIYTTENHGVSHARNLGFSKARGEFVWFVDSDDYVEPDACELLYHKAITDGNDLVLFRYYNVDGVSGKRKEFDISHYNQNFKISDKPYELPAISPYPWIKFIKYELFEGLAFPEGIRFEDLPVAYLLAVRASSIGVVNECLYNYRKNIGFLSSLNSSTLDVKKAIIYLKENIERLGFGDTYREELDFIAVRHFLYRFWKLLTNYETGKKALKLQLVNELFDYIEREIPGWRDNHYVKYSLPGHISRMLYLYGSREEMLRFVENCDGMKANEQKAWLREYKSAHEAELSYRPSDRISREKEARDAYEKAYAGGETDGKQIFLESGSGLGMDLGIRALVLYLTQEKKEYHIILSLRKNVQRLADFPEKDARITLVEPETKEYGKALAASRYLVADSPLPYYMKKKDTQCFILLCGSSLYPLTVTNSRLGSADTGLWQHSMFLADYLYFPDEIIRRNYIKDCKIQEICMTPYFVGKAPEEKSHGNSERRMEIRKALGMKDEQQIIMCCPQPLGENIPGALQAYRSLVSGLYQLDCELGDGQTVYLWMNWGNDLDFSRFTHILPMPDKYEFFDFASACDVFISDYHPGLVYLAGRGKKTIQFLCDGDSCKKDTGFLLMMGERGILQCDNVPELVRLLNDRNIPASVPDAEEENRNPFGTAQEFLKAVLDGKEPEGLLAPEATGCPRILCYAGGRLSEKRKEELRALAADSAGKNIWIAFNEFQNADMGRSLSHIVPGCLLLPLKPYSKDDILFFGRKECRKYLRNAAFDEVVITSTDYVEILKAILPPWLVKKGRNLQKKGRKILQKCKLIFQKP